MNKDKWETLKEMLQQAKINFHSENEIAQERVVDWILGEMDKLEDRM